MSKQTGFPAFNEIHNKKTFDVTAIVTVYTFDKQVWTKPKWEQYGFSQLFLVLEGCGYYRTESDTYSLSPGSLFYRPAGKQSCYYLESPVKYALISFVCRSEAMAAFEGQPIPLCEEEMETLLDVIRTAVRICEPSKGRHIRLGMQLRDNVPDVVLSFIYASLERFLAMVYCRIRNIMLLTDESQKVSRFLNEATLTSGIKEYLEENIHRSLTVKEVCDHFGMSPTALTRKFRKETNRSLMDYFTELKVDAAKKMIRSGSLSFGEIAEQLGFASANYFAKVFKARTGRTPTEFSRHVSKRHASGKIL